MSIRHTTALVIAVGTILAGAACSSSSNNSSSSSCSIQPSSGSSSTSNSSGEIRGTVSRDFGSRGSGGSHNRVVGNVSANLVSQAVARTAQNKGPISMSGQNFTEMQIMAEMYKQVLEKAGYTVNVNLVDTRDVYIKQLESGGVDIAPEYVAGIADYLNTAANGPNAKSTTTNDVTASLAALKPLADQVGITMLNPAKATDQNAFAVTKACADKYHLTTLSDLAGLNAPLTLAAAPDCKGRSDCQGGLSSVYHLNILPKILPLGYDSPQTKDSVTKGESQLGEVATTDGAAAEQGLVILRDDKGIQPAQNLIPAMNTAFLKAHPDIASVLNKLSATLTTQDLASLDKQVDVDRVQASDAASTYLKNKGLI